MSAVRTSARRVQLRLDLNCCDRNSSTQSVQIAVAGPQHDRTPRPIAHGIGTVLRALLPDPAQARELTELSGPERCRLYDLAGLSPLHRAELEDGVRQAIRQRYRRAA